MPLPPPPKKPLLPTKKAGVPPGSPTAAGTAAPLKRPLSAKPLPLLPIEKKKVPPSPGAKPSTPAAPVSVKPPGSAKAEAGTAKSVVVKASTTGFPKPTAPAGKYVVAPSGEKQVVPPTPAPGPSTKPSGLPGVVGKAAPVISKDLSEKAAGAIKHALAAKEKPPVAKLASAAAAVTEKPASSIGKAMAKPVPAAAAAAAAKPALAVGAAAATPVLGVVAAAAKPAASAAALIKKLPPLLKPETIVGIGPPTGIPAGRKSDALKKDSATSSPAAVPKPKALAAFPVISPATLAAQTASATTAPKSVVSPAAAVCKPAAPKGGEIALPSEQLRDEPKGSTAGLCKVVTASGNFVGFVQGSPTPRGLMEPPSALQIPQRRSDDSDWRKLDCRAREQQQPLPRAARSKKLLQLLQCSAAAAAAAGTASATKASWLWGQAGCCCSCGCFSPFTAAAAGTVVGAAVGAAAATAAAKTLVAETATTPSAVKGATSPASRDWEEFVSSSVQKKVPSMVLPPFFCCCPSSYFFTPFFSPSVQSPSLLPFIKAAKCRHLPYNSYEATQHENETIKNNAQKSSSKNTARTLLRENLPTTGVREDSPSSRGRWQQHSGNEKWLTKDLHNLDAYNEKARKVFFADDQISDSDDSNNDGDGDAGEERTTKRRTRRRRERKDDRDAAGEAARAAKLRSNSSTITTTTFNTPSRDDGNGISLELQRQDCCSSCSCWCPPNCGCFWPGFLPFLAHHPYSNSHTADSLMAEGVIDPYYDYYYSSYFWPRMLQQQKQFQLQQIQQQRAAASAVTGRRESCLGAWSSPSFSGMENSNFCSNRAAASFPPRIDGGGRRVTTPPPTIKSEALADWGEILMKQKRQKQLESEKNEEEEKDLLADPLGMMMTNGAATTQTVARRNHHHHRRRAGPAVVVPTCSYAKNLDTLGGGLGRRPDGRYFHNTRRISGGRGSSTGGSLWTKPESVVSDDIAASPEHAFVYSSPDVGVVADYGLFSLTSDDKTDDDDQPENDQDANFSSAQRFLRESERKNNRDPFAFDGHGAPADDADDGPIYNKTPWGHIEKQLNSIRGGDYGSQRFVPVNLRPHQREEELLDPFSGDFQPTQNLTCLAEERAEDKRRRKSSSQRRSTPIYGDDYFSDTAEESAAATKKNGDAYYRNFNTRYRTSSQPWVEEIVPRRGRNARSAAIRGRPEKSVFSSGRRGRKGWDKWDFERGLTAPRKRTYQSLNELAAQFSRLEGEDQSEVIDLLLLCRKLEKQIDEQHIVLDMLENDLASANVALKFPPEWRALEGMDLASLVPADSAFQPTAATPIFLKSKSLLPKEYPEAFALPLLNAAAKTSPTSGSATVTETAKKPPDTIAAQKTSSAIPLQNTQKSVVPLSPASPLGSQAPTALKTTAGKTTADAKGPKPPPPVVNKKLAKVAVPKPVFKTSIKAKP